MKNRKYIRTSEPFKLQAPNFVTM